MHKIAKHSLLSHQQCSQLPLVESLNECSSYLTQNPI